MKSSLLLLASYFTLPLCGLAQPVLLNNNKNLVVGYPISTTKAIFIQQETDENLLAHDTLWVTDGTPINTRKINVPVGFDRDGDLLPWNGKMYFAGITAANGSELWVTDGTDAGTHIVKDINPGAGSSTPRSPMAYNGFLYFFADNGTQGMELWKSDGTTAGTSLLKDINAGGDGSALDHISYGYFNNELYFVAKSALGEEIWKTNGTSAGTVLLKDINPNGASSNPILLRTYGNTLLFVADDGFHGEELWKTNGTAAGTEMVKDIFPGAGSSDVETILQLNGKFIFVAANASGNRELWTSDLTESGTVMLKEIEAGTAGSNPNLTNCIFINNRILFPATTTATGRELFYTDGTAAGTGLFKDFTPGPTSSAPEILLDNSFFNLGADYDPNHVLYNGKIFISTAANFVSKLWITDGTPANTKEVKDFGPMGMMYHSHYYTQSGFYFAASDPNAGIEIFKSTGTPSTTSIFADVNTGVPSAMPYFMFFMLNGKVFFSADNGDSEEGDRDLYVLGGTEQPLPLQLLNFAAAAVTDGINLNWTTIHENESKEFEVQRSIDGSNFQFIGTVKAAGNTQSKKEYAYPDNDAYKQKTTTLYYRLKMVDKDGRYTYSKVVFIQLNKPAVTGIELTPNPARNFVRLNYNSDVQQDAQARIINNNGQVVQQITTHLSPGINQQVISTEKLAPGVYQVQLILKNSEAAITRFIKQ